MKVELKISLDVDYRSVLRYMRNNEVELEGVAIAEGVTMHLLNSEVLSINDVWVQSCSVFCSEN